jgi:hypothetical protein
MVVEKSTRIAIYGLIDPRTHQIRYVGMSTNPEQRFGEHLRQYRSENTPKSAWIKTLWAHGLRPDMIVIEECGDDWKARERYWVARIPNLLNALRGGGANSSHLPHVAEKIRTTLKGKVYGHTPEWVAKRAHLRGNRGHHQPESMKQFLRQKFAGKKLATQFEYTVIEPDGTEYPVDDLTKFCLERGLSQSAMRSIAKGTWKNPATKGWRCKYR